MPIPAELSDEAAVPVLCAGLTVYKGLKESNTKVGDWVVIPGAGGGLGHLGTIPRDAAYSIHVSFVHQPFSMLLPRAFASSL